MSNKTNPRLKVNLKEIFGEDIDDPSLKQVINQAILDKILARTGKGKDVNNKSFAKYTKEYVNSIAFQAFGKSKSKVNLRLTGDMLELMDVLSETKNTSTFGWDDNEEGGKAHGHITQPANKENKRPRDFFGLTNKDIKELRAEFSNEVSRG